MAMIRIAIRDPRRQISPATNPIASLLPAHSGDLQRSEFTLDSVVMQ
jgi:hypothetical protein